jgi:NADH-quinone oxidoreductase subunit H
MNNILSPFFDPATIDYIIDIGKMLFGIITVFGIALLHVPYATYFERKVIGHMQVRLGPIEVGYHGLLQPIADGIKLLFKEDIIPTHANKGLFYIAPLIIMISALTSLAVVPFFDTFVIADINIGLLFLFAMSSLGAYGIVIGGWASNSKYAFLGGLRSGAQVISYEVAMGLSLVGVMIMAGSLNLTEIVRVQYEYPTSMFVFPQFLGFFVFVVAAFAETNRLPFDLPEAEGELVAGYFSEYSGIRFALFSIGEYIGMIIMSSIAALCFLGGWTIPQFVTNAVPFLLKVPGVVWLLMKIYAFMFFYFWVRATVPRYRFDQLMAIGWKILIPLSLLNILITGLIKAWVKGLI